MRQSVYIKICGEDFDPVAFNRVYGEAFGGQVKTWKQRLSGKVATGSYWASRVIDVSNAGDECATLRELLQAMKPSLLELLEKNVSITAQIVGYYKQRSGPRGIHLSTETIELLKEIGAQLDYDIVRDLRRGSRAKSTG